MMLYQVTTEVTKSLLIHGGIIVKVEVEIAMVF